MKRRRDVTSFRTAFGFLLFRFQLPFVPVRGLHCYLYRDSRLLDEADQK